MWMGKEGSKRGSLNARVFPPLWAATRGKSWCVSELVKLKTLTLLLPCRAVDLDWIPDIPNDPPSTVRSNF